jgi:hypothetical protein
MAVGSLLNGDGVNTGYHYLLGFIIAFILDVSHTSIGHIEHKEIDFPIRIAMQPHGKSSKFTNR